MAETINLSECRLQIWRPHSSRKSVTLEGLVFGFSPSGELITIKQFSELDSTDSFVAYNLKVSDCTYLSSEYLSADVRIIRLQLDKAVAPATCVDPRINPQAVEVEVATLEMCPMAGLRLQNGCKIDLIIPHDSLHQSSIAQLLELFGDGPKKEKRLSDQVQFPTLIQKDKPRPTSLILNDSDFEYLEASAKPPQLTAAKPKLGRGRFDQDQRLKLDQLSLQEKIPSFQPKSTEIPGTEKATGEQFLVDTWTKTQEMFEQIAPKSRQDVSTSRSVGLNSGLEANRESRTQWVDFATSHGSSRNARNNTTNQGDRRFEGSVLDPRKTGGYLQDSNRDYSRPDDQQLSTQNTTATRGHRGRGRYKAASFIPRTNSPRKRPEPEW